MKYYSDITNKIYETREELEAEERQKCLREEEEAKLRHEEVVERAVQTVRAMRAAKIIQDYLKENPDDLSSQ